MEPDYLSGIIDPNIGPVVPVTIGLSFAEARQRVDPPPMIRVSGLVDTGLEISGISQEVYMELGASSKVHTRHQYIPLRGVELRSFVKLYIAIESFMPNVLFRSIEVTVGVHTGSPQCVLGRNFLEGIELQYSGAFDIFGLKPSQL